MGPGRHFRKSFTQAGPQHHALKNLPKLPWTIFSFLSLTLHFVEGSNSPRWACNDSGICIIRNDTSGHRTLRSKVNAAMHVFARRCIPISQAETYRESPQGDKVSTSKWLFHSNNLELSDIFTKTVRYWGEGRGKGWSSSRERKFPSASQLSPRSPFITGDRSELRSWPSPLLVSQHSVVNTRRVPGSAPPPVLPRTAGYEWPHYSRLLFTRGHAQTRAPEVKKI